MANTCLLLMNWKKKATFNKGIYAERAAALIHLKRAYFFSTMADPGQSSDL